MAGLSELLSGLKRMASRGPFTKPLNKKDAAGSARISDRRRPKAKGRTPEEEKKWREDLLKRLRQRFEDFKKKRRIQERKPYEHGIMHPYDSPEFQASAKPRKRRRLAPQSDRLKSVLSGLA